MSAVPSKYNKWSILIGLCGAFFIGYCIYFDCRRRSDPNFRKKLKQRREREKNVKKPQLRFPDLTDQAAIQAFFFRQVQLGEEQLSIGNLEDGIEHFCNAVTICGQPNQILQILQQTLPPNIFYTLLQRLPGYTERLVDSSMTWSASGDNADESTIE